MIEEFKNTSKVSANPKKIKKKASEIKKFIKKEKNKINSKINTTSIVIERKNSDESVF